MSRWIFFFNDPATTEIYTLSLHDALPILPRVRDARPPTTGGAAEGRGLQALPLDGIVGVAAAAGSASKAEIGRAHVLNSSHANISYAVFCLKKKHSQTLSSIFSINNSSGF